MPQSLSRWLTAVMAASVLVSACVTAAGPTAVPNTASSPAGSDAPGVASPSATPASPAATPFQAARTYSKDVQPLTSGQGCRTCHKNPPTGTYEQDKTNRNNISRMARINGTKAGLNAEQIAALQAWVAAGAPDDSQTF